MQRSQRVLRKFGVRMWVLMGCLLVLTILGGYFFANVLDQARIGSERYASIIAVKSLQADAESPSLRLSETQLAVQEIALAGVAASDSDLARLTTLETDYRDAHDVWAATVTDPGTQGALRTADQAADDYFSEVDGPFLTAARSGDAAAMAALVAGSVGEKYVVHEAAVDDVAQAATSEFVAAERAARQSLQDDKTMLLLLILGLGLVGIVVTAVTVRSMTKRLRGMREVASKDFPRLIAQAELSADAEVEAPSYTAPHVRGHDELARTERAFHGVVGAGIEIATHQARLRQMTSDMLVYIGRRNHQRLTGGLTSVAELEGVPLGPERTAQMQWLEALMTRMRRDSESMLVVAGVPAMRSWTEPVTVHDSITVSVSEVNAPERVHLELADFTQLPGQVGSDLAHLMAELVENGLAFSEPDSIVSVIGRAEQDGYELLVSDDGLGIEPQQLAELNELLANGEMDLHDSRRLGLSVVARLAFRNDIDVALSHKATGGLIARVWLPPACFVEVPAVSNSESGSTLAAEMRPSLVPSAAALGKHESLPRRIRGANLDDSLRDGAGSTSTIALPETRSAESVRTTLSALAMGQLAAREHHDAGSEH